MTRSAEASPKRALLATAAGLAALSLGWSAFLWIKLAEAQSGATVRCAFGDSTSCTTLWDSPFARAVHAWSHLPVAGWGVLWSLLALGLPLAILLRGRPRSADPLWPANVCTAGAGLAAVFGLLAVSASVGAFCRDCGLIYVLVGGYAVLIAREALRLGPLPLGRGALVAVLGAAVSYGVLLYPASHTPLAAIETTRIAVATAPTAEAPEAALGELLSQLGPSGRQQLANALAVYRGAEAKEMRPARGLIGSPNAAVRLTEFADLLCSHCAELNVLLHELRKRLPADAFALEPRYFPLDGRCNALLAPAPGEPTRCIAAKAMICAAGQPSAVALADQLFAEQQRMTPERVYELAAAALPPPLDIRTCVASPDTDARLREDVAWAAEHHIQGTPLVLMNGKPVAAFPPVLYALLLARGDADHPIFAALPPAQPQTAQP